jgi:hypothetical protein
MLKISKIRKGAMEEAIMVGLALLIVVIAGSICGVIALVKLQKFKTRLRALENDLKLLHSLEPVE